MNTFIQVTQDLKEQTNMKKIFSLPSGKHCLINMGDATFSLPLTDNKMLYLFGDIFYYVLDDATIKPVNSESGQFLKELFAQQSIEDVVSRLEGQYIGIITDQSQGWLKIFSDRYARKECFYSYNNGEFCCGSDLDFVFKTVTPEYDQLMIAHLLFVYGWYTPKGLTIYKNVLQLQSGEVVTFSAQGKSSERIEFKPLPILHYEDKELETYYEVLRDSIVSRAQGKDQAWVSTSSGWDSTMLVGILVDALGPKKVKMLAGSMLYSGRAQVVNQFEIDKIEKIGTYYGINPEIVTFDRSKRTAQYWKDQRAEFKSRHMYTLAGFNYAQLSDRCAELAGPGQIVFNGESSDSFHNFGFSQFATFFHTQKPFTEYADKMNCYLYGPSFFKKVVDGTYQKDKVFQIFQKMMPDVTFAEAGQNRSEMIQRYLFPMFYGTPRIPFAVTYNNPLLTQNGRQQLFDFPFKQYMPQVLQTLNEDNLYSWYVYLYENLQAQSSNTNCQKHAMEMNKHHWRTPFNDLRLVKFLSQMPEDWGRGLNLNHIKHPLKWVGKNKIKYPYELLDKGPHSYLYDVIEGFSLAAEVFYHSEVTPYLKEVMAQKQYQQLITDEYVDRKYVDKLVDDFLGGKEAQGADFNNLIGLVTFSTIGWY